MNSIKKVMKEMRETTTKELALNKIQNIFFDREENQNKDICNGNGNFKM